VLAAVAAATPYLFFERRDSGIGSRTRLAGDGGAIAARASARGLAHALSAARPDDEIEAPCALREMARAARPGEPRRDARRWIEVIAVTDIVDGAERDPLDLELGLENLMRLAAQYDDEEADARAARFASALAPTFQEASKIALGRGASASAPRRSTPSRAARAPSRSASGLRSSPPARRRAHRGAGPRDTWKTSPGRPPRSSTS
jgi:hypothetical protein